MLKFTTVVVYGDQQLQVESDNLKDLHDAVARIEELSREAQYLRDAGATSIVLERHRNGDNEWFGFGDAADPRHCVSFGQYREGDSKTVPFFPSQDGYYRPDDYAASETARAEPLAPEASGGSAEHADVTAFSSDQPTYLPPPSDGAPPVASEADVARMGAAFAQNDWSREPAGWVLQTRYGVESTAFVPAHKVDDVIRDAGNVRLKAAAEDHVRRSRS